MLRDKIKFRKIRYDVLEYLDQVSFINKINDYLSNKSQYENNNSYTENLLREARLDTSVLDYNVASKLLSDYRDNLLSVDSLDKATLMEYISNVIRTTGIPDLQDEYASAYDELLNFIFQFLQIQTLQAQMINSVTEVMYMGEDKCLYDIKDDSLIIDATQYLAGLEVNEDTNYDFLALNYIADKIIDRQRGLFTSFDYDEEGFYITGDGEEIFLEEAKKDIVERSEDIITQLLSVDGENEKVVDELYDDGTGKAQFATGNRKVGRAAWEESKNRYKKGAGYTRQRPINNPATPEVIEDSSIDKNQQYDIIEDVTTTENEQTKERLKNLKKSLEEQSNKIKKR